MVYNFVSLCLTASLNYQALVKHTQLGDDGDDSRDRLSNKFIDLNKAVFPSCVCKYFKLFVSQLLIYVFFSFSKYFEDIMRKIALLSAFELLRPLLLLVTTRYPNLSS